MVNYREFLGYFTQIIGAIERLIDSSIKFIYYNFFSSLLIALTIAGVFFETYLLISLTSFK